jgi:hypothetical protein
MNSGTRIDDENEFHILKNLMHRKMEMNLVIYIDSSQFEFVFGNLRYHLNFEFRIITSSRA